MPARWRRSAAPSAGTSPTLTRASPPALRPRADASVSDSGFGCDSLDDSIDLGSGGRVRPRDNLREFGLTKLRLGGFASGCKNVQRHRVQQVSEIQVVVPFETQAMDIPLLCQPDDLFL